MAEKTILVSGANGNLGKGVVDYFLERNNQVIGLMHHTNGKNSENFKEFQADLTDEAATEKVMADILNKYDPIDTAVLTAGGFAMGKLKDTDTGKLEEQYRLNFVTAYNAARPLVAKLKEQGQGTLFFIGSEPGMDTRKAKSTVAYSLSKSLLFQLANIINAELNKTRARAYVVVPGTIDTPQNREAVPDADFDQWETPGEIAEIIDHYTDKKAGVEKTSIVMKDEL